MKKIYFIAALLATATAANAQMQETGRIAAEYGTPVIPRLFTHGDNLYITTSAEEGEGVGRKTTFTIYNDDIEKVRSFEVGGYTYECRIERQVRKSQDEQDEDQGGRTRSTGAYTGEWETTSSYTDRVGEIPTLYFYDYDENSSPKDGFRLTQTLFNTDEKFEYIRFDFDENTASVTYEEDRDGDGIIDRRQVQYGAITGFSIVQEDGTVLQTIKADDVSFGSGDGNLLKLNGKLYLIGRELNSQSGSSNTYEYVYYRIDPQTNSVKRIDTPMGMVVRPSVADRDTQVTVDLDGDAREIQVVNAAGQTIRRIPVGEGQRQVTFSTRGMSNGVNVVRATGHGTHASRKMVVK